jgi:plasmid segregation protein ParM
MNKSQIESLIPKNVFQAFLRTDNIPDINKELVVRALDIGYGFTKYTKGLDDEGNIDCDLFPSIAALSPQEEMGGDFFVARNTRVIESGGLFWEVGPDVGDIKTTNDVRALHENFIHSEQWKVLFLGALAYMEEDTIDYLVLGLPVSDMKRSDEVRKLAESTHKVNGKEITVKNVFVIPQPLGTLYNYAIREDKFEKFMNSITLVVDPGYLTFDFLVTKGFSVNSHRSGARPGGMSSILNAISGSISKLEGTEFEDLEQIDAALKIHLPKKKDEKRVVSLYGKEIELTPHIKNTVPVIESSMNYMLQKIGTSKDINQIIMGGGPNRIFDKSIKKQFSKHEVLALDDGIFANVIGFLLWGMMTSYGLEINAK